MTKKLYLFVLTLALFSCNQREEATANTDLSYFDIKGYFGKEALRLKAIDPVLVKTVSVNGITESKTIHIADWQKELAIFTNADINKASWKGSFKIAKENGFDTYTANDKKIPVKKIMVKEINLKVDEIRIIINNKNILFQSNDTLTYLPNHLYEVRKQQKIRFLKDRNYKITGRFK